MSTTESAATTTPDRPQPVGADADSGQGDRPHATGQWGPTGGRSALVNRVSPPMPSDRVAGWVWPLAVAVLAGVLRFWRLGVPDTHVFDEVYYANEAWQLLHYGVEYNVKDATPNYVVHPPLGKWTIALGQWLFGDDSFGWRFSAALVGTLSVLLVARVARRMTRSTLLGCVAGLLLAFDGLHFVSSRTALLDVFLMAAVLAAFACLVVDRDASRARLAELVERRGLVGPGGRVSGTGPGLGLRPWRLAAGVMLGVAVATKWSGVYAIAAFGLMTVFWDMGARRAVGITRARTAALLRDAGPAFASLVVLPVFVYVASWTGWFLSGDKGWDRHWAEGSATSYGFVPDAIRSLWHYHAGMYDFHTTLDSPHPYQSSPWGWLVLARPVSFFFESPKRGEEGCHAETCAREVLGLGTPAIWWAAVGALLVMLWLWLGRRDWRGGAVLAGVAAGYLPWFLFTDRTVFSFYTIVLAPYLAIALALTLGVALGGRDASPIRRRWVATVAGMYLLLVIVNFHHLYPVLSAELIPYDAWLDRMWFRSWI
ncbi:MAG: dolichyl-phosphate-mannose--protein mannosyltransferase [Actinomycetes bacterium]